jgi:hypothetical protein
MILVCFHFGIFEIQNFSLVFANGLFCPSFADGVGDLSAFEPHVLASGLKKLLRELPDPTIPSQWYDAFIEASRKTGKLFFFFLELKVKAGF